MDTIITWLKSSILGIVILGAIGSIAAAIVVWFSTRIVPRSLGIAKRRTHSNKEVFEALVGSRDYVNMLIFLLHHMTAGMTALIGGCTFTIIALSEMNRDGELHYSPIGVLALSASFLLLGGGFYYSLIFDWAFKKHVLPKVKEIEDLANKKG